MDKNNNGQKTSFYQELVSFTREHPVLMNFIYVIIAGVVLVWLVLLFLDSWTRHGEEAVVPALRGQTVELAAMTLEGDGFGCEVMDSVFESSQRPGTVVEQVPQAGSRVKPGRTVYLTIVAYSPKMVTVPDFMNVSRRQGQSMFEGLGLRVHIVTVASQYKDLVMGAKVNGVPLRPGQRIPVTSNVTLEVGGGDLIEPADSNLVMPDGGKAAITDGDETPDVSTDDYSGDLPAEDPTIQMLLQDTYGDI